ncbi:glycosyltransferase family 2 protein [Streptomyces cyaneochromogenes]|uniref:dolichyl-phosphate beta-glucosyltransferase n=1 Tax=Streptomyces cyaneochromogenes TaxID=2496836 RepID=A0A3S9MAK7_9ACTN|nr:dolichyl-phosphate beta-glucosyltransferase [Streptomyces cyaneochromogenes]AZQ36379.1 glycosyltransferase family 2 protein [Streptomyces cyaneochromogenes]
MSQERERPETPDPAKSPDLTDSADRTDLTGDSALPDRTGDSALPGLPDLSIVIPAYNEEQRLTHTLDALTDHLTADDAHWPDWEIVVADDGSTDATRDLVAERARQDPRIHLVTAPRNRGKGHALRLGVAATRGRRVLVTDADLATPIEELERLDKALSEGNCAAIGSRSVPGATIGDRQHRVRELLGRAGNLLIRRTAVPGIRDTQCGFKLYDGDRAREAYAASRVHGWAIDVEVLRHLHRAGLPIAEVPVRWSHRPGSKVTPLDYARTLAEITRISARSLRPADLFATFLFLLMSVALYSARFFDPAHRYLPDSLRDQNQWEWFFAVTADNVAHLRNPLFTDLQGFPDGVNLMANTVMPGLSVPLTPLTLTAGPAVTLSLVMTLGLAATAAAWYWLIVKYVVRGRIAAFAGASLAAFAPPMVSHAHAHPNFVVLFMIPLIIDRALRLCTGTRVVRDGVALGLMAAYQVFLGEEALLLAALGMALFAAAYAVVRRDTARTSWRPLLRGLLIGASVCLPLVVYPLVWQFAGPRSYSDIEHNPRSFNSPLALLSFAERSWLAGDAETANALAFNTTEQNAFYGWPLVLLAFAILVRLWERALVRALAFTAVAAAVLSLGREFRIPLTDLTVPGPWKLLADKPLFEAVIESRVAMICAPALGILLALAVDRLLTARAPHTRYVGLLGVGLALLPLIPAPLRAVDRVDVPAFIADGTWKSYVREGESLVPVPLPDPGDAEALHWQTEAGLGFKLAGGYFNGPYGDERIGIYGAEPRLTSSLLREVRNSGEVPPAAESWREQARADLAYWRAGVLVLAPQPNDGALRETVEKLVGAPGRWVDGVWVWDLHQQVPTHGLTQGLAQGSDQDDELAQGVRPRPAPITLP